jgi:hypothetical protein
VPADRLPAVPREGRKQALGWLARFLFEDLPRRPGRRLHELHDPDIRRRPDEAMVPALAGKRFLAPAPGKREFYR